MLRAALQRRADKMNPPSGWEERTLDKLKKPIMRRLWIAVAAAACMLALLMPKESKQTEVSPLPEPGVRLLIAERPQIKAEKPPVRVNTRAQRPVHRQAKKVTQKVTENHEIVFDAVVIEDVITVEQELESIFAMVDNEMELFDAYASSFDELNPILISTYLTEE